MPSSESRPPILVAVDASGASRLALELAADLAAALRRELAGLYVEEQDLLHAAGLPFVREVRARSGQAAPFTAAALERHWRALAEEARQAVRRAAEARRIAWRFEVVRGRPAQVLAQAARGVGLAGLGASAQGAGRLGSVARAVLASAEASLLLAPPRRPAGERWLALLDTPQGAAAVLALAGALAATPTPPLLLATPPLASLGPAPLRRRVVATPPALPALAALARAEAARGLILAADSPLAAPAAVERLLAEHGWPVLLAR